MGVTVRQKVKGKGKLWWVFIAHNGKRKSIKVGDKASAEALASKVREKLKSGELQLAPPKKIPTFGEYAQKWLNNHGEANLKYSTQKSYENILNHHLGRFVDCPIDRITRPELKELVYEKLKAGLAPNTVRNIKAMVSAVLSHALEDELLVANPASRLGRLIKTKERNADVQPLTQDEARAFLEAVRAHYPGYYPFFLCARRSRSSARARSLRISGVASVEPSSIMMHSKSLSVWH